MNRILFFTIFFWLLSTSLLRAQDIKGPFIGVTSAYNSTWVIIDRQPDDSNLKYRKTWKWAPVGAVAGYKFNEHHSLQAEAIRSRQGAGFDIKDESGNIIGEKRIDLNYWAFPLLFKYTTGGNLRFNFHIGPQFSFLTYGREENVFTGAGVVKVEGHTNRAFNQNDNTLFASTVDADRQNDPNVGGFNTFDPSLAFGLGLEADLVQNLYVSANLRFNYGFKEIRDKEYINDPRDVEPFVLRYNVWGGVQIGLHYFINRGD